MENVKVDRATVTQERMNQIAIYDDEHFTVKNRMKRTFTFKISDVILSRIPFVMWIREYEFKKWILNDLLAGLTIGIFHIPQGMSYAMLGHVPPIHGLYMAFFPVIAYIFMGTCKQASVGTFASVTILSGEIVQAYRTDGRGTLPRADNSTIVSAVDVAVTVAFACAALQGTLYLLKLGVIATLMSDTLTSGFIAATAMQVTNELVADMLGIKTPQKGKYFKIARRFYTNIRDLPKANKMTMCISGTILTILVIFTEIFKPWLKTKSNLPIPMEFFCIIGATAVSHVFDLNHHYNVSIIGSVPSGFPTLTIPMFSIIPEIFVSVVVIVMLQYFIQMTLALLFSQKHGYDVNSQQELLALSTCNFIGSFSGCLPVNASMSRSLLQDAVGGQTQLASVMVSIVMVTVLLWFGPLFFCLPKCVLGTIVIVALKTMMMKVTHIYDLMIMNRWDAIIWIVTFLATFIFDIQTGLVTGLTITVIVIIAQLYYPYSCVLGIIPNNGIYLDVERFQAAQELDGIKIFYFSGILNFATKYTFIRHIVEQLKFDPKLKIKQQSKGDDGPHISLSIKCVIVDFTALTRIDHFGVDTVVALANNYGKLDIKFAVAGCTAPVYRTFAIVMTHKRKYEENLRFFPTLHDAVAYAKSVKK